MDNSTIYRLKRKAVELYRDTSEEITESLLRGKLMHAVEELHVGVKGKASYVWVFTSMEEVIYIWSETREGSVAGEFLKGYKGVLVSDFYSAYDSIDCPQQKCLIHLIRDLNNHVLFKNHLMIKSKELFEISRYSLNLLSKRSTASV